MSTQAFARISHAPTTNLLHSWRNAGSFRLPREEGCPRGYVARPFQYEIFRPMSRSGKDSHFTSSVNYENQNECLENVSSTTKSPVKVDPILSPVNPPNFRPTGIMSPFSSFVKGIDDYKEATRFHRRTIFTDDDWVRFRSSDRIFENLSTTFTSILINGLWLEIGAVTLSAALVYLLNWLMFEGWLSPLIASGEPVTLSLPALPFQLSSPALGLLLVFRTNTVYMRWNMARMAWDNIQPLQRILAPMILRGDGGAVKVTEMTRVEKPGPTEQSNSLARQGMNHCNNLARQGMAYIKAPAEQDELARRIIALAFLFKRHFRTNLHHSTGLSSEDDLLRAKLVALLGAAEADRLLAAEVGPVQAMSDLSRIVRRTPNLDGSTRSRFDQQVDEMNRAYLTCEGLRRTPVPLVYTRHTERFLGLWTLLLPLALTRELGGSAAVIPMSAMVGLFLFGIEEIGVQIEEPFTIMPLEDSVARLEREVRQMLHHEVAFPDGDPKLGSDVAKI